MMPSATRTVKMLNRSLSHVVRAMDVVMEKRTST